MPTGVYPRKPFLERFWVKVDQRGPDECWPWLGSKSRRGYGEIQKDGRLERAHRASYLIAVGPIPDGHMVCHHCDNPSCVNPGHLFTGPAIANVLDMRRKGRAFGPPHESGEAHARAKLSAAAVQEIRSEHACGSKYPGHVAIAKRYGVTPSAIWRVVHGKNWRALAP